MAQCGLGDMSLLCGLQDSRQESEREAALHVDEGIESDHTFMLQRVAEHRKVNGQKCSLLGVVIHGFP